MYKIIYYSPTGNTRHLAYKLSELLDVNVNMIDALEFSDPKELKEEDHLILMYPIHGFNAPRTVKRFVKNIPDRIFKQVSLLAIGCNDLWLNDAVSSDLRKLFIKKNMTIVVDEILSMPLTFVMGFPKDVRDKTISKAVDYLSSIAVKIKASEVSVRKVKLKSKVVNLVGKLESPAARMFGLELHAKKTCDSCGVCWKNCPELNIKPNKNNKPSFGFKCSMCMRCIYNCHQNAITPYISKFLVIKEGYSISEIIE